MNEAAPNDSANKREKIKKRDFVQTLDTELHSLVSGIDILDAVAPQNFRDQKNLFFDSRYSVNPVFSYKEHKVDSFGKKRALFNLAVEQLKDPDLIQLYTEVIESYVDRIDQFRSIGSPEFLYDSLRYYGEPSAKDIRNAHFILHLPEPDEPEQEPLMTASQIIAHLEGFAQHEGYTYKIQLDDNLIANALVSGTTVKVNSTAAIPEIEAKALAHHELGVHLVTTLNARAQPLKILSLGSPVNTMTQEGLAILCEYLAGCMSLPRIKILALRVLAVESLIKEKSFKKTFLLLKEEYKVADQLAFTICARAYRGGGFTKDHLYLQGLHQMLNAYETKTHFNNLLCGKISLKHLDIVSRLIDKEILIPPKWISPAISRPAQPDPIGQFIAHAIK